MMKLGGGEGDIQLNNLNQLQSIQYSLSTKQLLNLSINSVLWNPITHCQEQNCPPLIHMSAILGLLDPEDEGNVVL